MNLKGLSVSVHLVWLVVGATLTAFSAYAKPSQSVSTVSSVRPEDQDYIDYQLRPGEDPSKVAHMFGVTVAQLLSLNHVRDPHRLAVGARLKIPDPRAMVLKELRAQKDTLAEQLAEAQASSSALQRRIDQVQAQVVDLHAANGELRSRQVWYEVWRWAGLLSGSAAVIIGFGLLVVWTRARDEQRRRLAASKQAKVMRTAVQKYRELGAQFELRYQNLFRQTGAASPTHERAQALQRAYDDYCARLDAIVSAAEREIEGEVVQPLPEGAARRDKAPMLRLSTARKSS